MPYKPFKTGNEYCVFKVDESGNKTGSDFGCHPTEEIAYKQIAAIEASEGKEQNRMDDFYKIIRDFVEKVSSLIDKDKEKKERKIKDVVSWDGSASNYASTEDYCNACLLDLNSAAGRETKAQSHCMLPVRGPGDASGTYVKQAVHAAVGGHGITQVKKPSDVPQEAWDSAVKEAANKLKSAYAQMEETLPDSVANLTRAVSFDTMMGQLWEDAQEKYPMAYFINAFTDDDGSIYGLMNEEGRLYRCPVMVTNGYSELGEREEVTMEFQPVSTRTLIRQLPDGKFRWISRSATSVLNRVGEIDSKDLFDSFIAHIERTNEYPIRQFYHQGEQFRTGQADFVARDGNVLITSGVYDDSELAKREIKAIQSNPTYWGESIGYLPAQQPELVKFGDVSIPVYRTGVFKEISTLPETEAANLFTTVYSMEVKRMLKGKIREAFVKLFGDNEQEAEKWLNENVEELNRSIQEEKLITRTAEDKPVEEVAKPIPTDIELDEAAVTAIVARVMESETIAPVIEVAMQHEVIVKLRSAVDELTVKLTELEQKLNDAQSHIANLEQSDNDKKRQWLEDAPKSTVAKVTYKPRQVQVENSVIPANEIAKAIRPKVAY